MVAFGTMLATAKGIYEVARRGGDIPLQAQILELQQQMLDAQAELQRLVNENAELRTETKRLRDNAELRSRMRFEDNVYWLDGKHDAEHGPFCPNCLDGPQQILMRLTVRKTFSPKCPHCSAHYEKPGEGGYRPVRY